MLNYCNLSSLVSQLEASADVATRKKQIAAFNEVCDFCRFNQHLLNET